MSSVIISGDTSGAITVSAPAVAGTNTLTLQAATATNSVNTLATAVASTSGTSIDYTGLPSWIKKITVMFNAVSTTGASNYLIQIGSGSLTTSGYSSCGVAMQSGTTNTTAVTSTAGLLATADFQTGGVTNTGTLNLNLITGSSYVCTALSARNDGARVSTCTGNISLAGALDRLRITTVNGTDTFDAGTINILYEG
jgi:hypothetical protein